MGVILPNPLKYSFRFFLRDRFIRIDFSQFIKEDYPSLKNLGLTVTMFF
jgi:hypothetical protein